MNWTSRILTVLLSTLALLIPSPFGSVSNVGAADAAPATQRVVAFGDSITWGVGTIDPDTQSWPARIGAARVANPGAQLVGPTGAVNTYAERVLAERPDVVTVAYGMNDLVWHSTPQIMRGLRAIVRMNNAAGIRTYIATLTPLGADFPWGIQPQRAELNERIRSHFPRKVIDFDAALRDDEGMLPERFDSGDGLHPNAAAYAVMARVAGRALSTTLR